MSDKKKFIDKTDFTKEGVPTVEDFAFIEEMLAEFKNREDVNKPVFLFFIVGNRGIVMKYGNTVDTVFKGSKILSTSEHAKNVLQKMISMAYLHEEK